MKKFIKSKKGLAALLATLTVVAFSAVGAYAYFTRPARAPARPRSARCPASRCMARRRPLYPAGAPARGNVLVTNPQSGHESSTDPPRQRHRRTLVTRP